MKSFFDQKGSSLLEVMAALVIFALAASGLAISIPFAYQRVPVWQEQYNVGRYLEKHLEVIRSFTFDEISLTDTGFITEGDYQYRRDTGYVADDQVNRTWADSASGSGDGLVATYYDNPDFTGVTVERIDATVSFDWGVNSPAFGIGPEGFSACWEGYVEPEFSETYTFYVKADEGVRLWVNDQLLVDHWETGAGEWGGTLDLEANVRYRIKLDYFDYTDNSWVELGWSSFSVLKSVIPQSRLYSTTAKMTIVTAQTIDGSMSLDGRVLTFDHR